MRLFFQVAPTSILREFARFVSSVLYSGRLLPAPGTIGSIEVALIWWWITTSSPSISAFLIAATLAVLSLLVGYAALLVHFSVGPGPKDDDWGDPGWVIIDEWVGMSISLLPIVSGDPVGAICAFALFRLFDIWKPWVISKVQDIPGAWGVLLDDILAGGCAALLCWLGAIVGML